MKKHKYKLKFKMIKMRSEILDNKLNKNKKNYKLKKIKSQQIKIISIISFLI